MEELNKNRQAFKDAAEQANKAQFVAGTPTTGYYTYPTPCPTCGRCPTCGQGGYWGYPPTYPAWTCASGRTTYTDTGGQSCSGSS